MSEYLREHLLQIRDAALKAVAPGHAVRNYLRIDPGDGPRTETLHLGETSWLWQDVRRLILVAAGKAALPMSQAAIEILGERLHSGVVVTRYGHAAGYTLPGAIRVYEAGHPVPDRGGQLAAEAIVELLTGLSADDRVMVLLSGGASALLPLPPGPVSLQELQDLTAHLLHAGATIVELNAVRKHLDRLKGGQLARTAAPASLAALILSDVVGDPVDVIASGPTAPDPTTFQDACQILKRFKLWDQAPASIRDYLLSGSSGQVAETPKPGDDLFLGVRNMVIGSNRLAALAAASEAERLGYRGLLLSTFIEGEAREVGKVAAALAKGIRAFGDPLPAPACVLLGGETTVTVRGAGKGGRNQELALAAALGLAGVPGVALMALATDGSDGPTDAAGAVVDGNTIERARLLGYDPFQALDGNDSYPLLEAAGALLRTGPTGTNVNDLTVVLVGK